MPRNAASLAKMLFKLNIDKIHFVVKN